MVGIALILFLQLPVQDTVTATTYTLAAAENGPYGNSLASGFKANKKHPGLNRVIAVSPDMLDSFPFHSYVIVKNASKQFNGIWKVEDVMNKRYTHRIDFLINYRTKYNKFYNVVIIKYGKKYKSNIRNHKSRIDPIHNVRAKQSYKHVKRHDSKVKESKRGRQSTNRTIQSSSYKRNLRSKLGASKRSKPQGYERASTLHEYGNRIKWK